MTTFRPDGEDAYGGGRPSPYRDPDTFEAAVGRLDDPLNDPLPGSSASHRDTGPAPGRPGGPAGPEGQGHAQQASHAWFGGPSQPHDPLVDPLPGTAYQDPAQGSPRYRDPAGDPGHPGAGQAGPTGPAPGHHASAGYAPGPGHTPNSAHPGPGEHPQPTSAYAPGAGTPGGRPPRHDETVALQMGGRKPADDAVAPHAAGSPPRHDETVALRLGDGNPATSRTVPAEGPDPAGGHPRHDETVALRLGARRPSAGRTGADDGTPATGGRAERRRAAREAARRGGRRARGRHGAGAAAGSATAAAEPPRTRVEARRAARAAKEPPSVVASRWIGEAFITMGVLMLLFVTYQLWWTNVLANQEAGGEATTLQEKWAKKARDPGAFSPGEGFAILYIPQLDVKTPIAEGIDKHRVLDRGMIGHYGEEPLKTAMPWEKKGNFALAGHRNTHGEPFRYINRLKPGDEVVVETRRAFYTYKMTSILPQTSPSNTAVIDPVPRGSGLTKPGRYITLTTCTPEFTSKFRLIVWGKMVEERPRSKGKPDALVQ